MAILGALVTGTAVVAGGVVIDLSRMSTAKTELMQILQTTCEHGAASRAAGDEPRKVKLQMNKLAATSYDQSKNISEGGNPRIVVGQNSPEIEISDTRKINFVFGGLTGIKESEVSATFKCNIPPPPVNMADPATGCSGDAITITNARTFRADADTAEKLTASRLISVAVVDRNDALLERVLVGDGGEPLFERNDLDISDTVVIQPVEAGQPVPQTCLPTPPTNGGGNPGNPGGGNPGGGNPGNPGNPGGGNPGNGGGGSGDCLTGSISGSTAGNELGFNTDGTYQAFFVDRSTGANSGGVSNGNSSASTSASLDGPGVTGGSAAIGDGSSRSCSSIVTDTTDTSSTSSADGDITSTTTDTSTSSNGDGTSTTTTDGSCASANANGGGSVGKARGTARGGTIIATSTGTCGS